jgi:hypothetical protein
MTELKELTRTLIQKAEVVAGDFASRRPSLLTSCACDVGR